MSAPGEDRPAPGGHSPADWDARYAESERMWSGDPNGLLVAEAATIPAGRVLDVGCGEGADAVWLAGRGFDVTAIDVSGVALERARRASRARGVEVDWRRCALGDLGPDERFDLVSAFYAPLTRASGDLAALLGAVAPGGRLLFVHHTDIDRERALAHGFDPDDMVLVPQVAEAVAGGDWLIEAEGVRERQVSGGAGVDHHTDGIVRARRTR